MQVPPESLLREFVASVLSENLSDAVPVAVDEEETARARASFGLFPNYTVAKFESGISLYRVVDDPEWRDILATGVVKGGNFAVKAERAQGASWGNNVNDVVAFGLKWKRMGRLSGQLRVLKIDGFDRVFGHVDPELAAARDGTQMMRRGTCSVALGCSVRGVELSDVEAAWALDDEGGMKPLQNLE